MFCYLSTPIFPSETSDILRDIMKDVQKNVDLRLLSVAIGTMLGDGHIAMRNTNTCNMRFRHGSLQQNYISWKFENLKILAAPSSKVHYSEQYDKKAKKWYGTCSFSLAAGPLFVWLHSVFYKWDGKTYVKFVPEIIMQVMNDLLFAVLMGDDGKFSAYHYEIACYSFSHDCQTRLVDAINKVLGLNGSVARYNSKFYLIRFPAADTAKIASICAKHWPEGLRYKLPPSHPLYQKPSAGMGLPLPLSSDMAIWRDWYEEQVESGSNTLGYEKWLKTLPKN